MSTDSNSQPATTRHRILNCNILLNLPEHKGKQDWDLKRGPVCIQIIESHKPDLICLQEVGADQDQDFIKAFPNFTSFGYVDPYVDKKPKRFQSCKNVVLYSNVRYSMVSQGIYWLTDQPQIPGSRIPKDHLPRHVSWVRLLDNQTNHQFRIMSTHWSLTKSSRIKESQIIVSETTQYQNDFPQLICGDFNSDQTSEEHHILTAAGWKDTYQATHGPQVPPFTGHDFSDPPKQPHKNIGKIDFIYARGNVKSIAAKIISDNIDGQYPSDHYFVSADVEL